MLEPMTGQYLVLHHSVNYRCLIHHFVVLCRISRLFKCCRSIMAVVQCPRTAQVIILTTTQTLIGLTKRELSIVPSYTPVHSMYPCTLIHRYSMYPCTLLFTCTACTHALLFTATACTHALLFTATFCLVSLIRNVTSQSAVSITEMSVFGKSIRN